MSKHVIPHPVQVQHTNNKGIKWYMDGLYCLNHTCQHLKMPIVENVCCSVNLQETWDAIQSLVKWTVTMQIRNYWWFFINLWLLMWCESKCVVHGLNKTLHKSVLEASRWIVQRFGMGQVSKLWCYTNYLVWDLAGMVNYFNEMPLLCIEMLLGCNRRSLQILCLKCSTDQWTFVCLTNSCSLHVCHHINVVIKQNRTNTAKTGYLKILRKFRHF